MMFLLQAVGVVAGGVFVVGFAKGFLEALADQHRRRRAMIEELGPTGPAPELKVLWPDDAPTRRRRGAKR